MPPSASARSFSRPSTTCARKARQIQGSQRAVRSLVMMPRSLSFQLLFCRHGTCWHHYSGGMGGASENLHESTPVSSQITTPLKCLSGHALGPRGCGGLRQGFEHSCSWPPCSEDRPFRRSTGAPPLRGLICHGIELPPRAVVTHLAEAPHFKPSADPSCLPSTAPLIGVQGHSAEAVPHRLRRRGRAAAGPGRRTVRPTSHGHGLCGRCGSARPPSSVQTAFTTHVILARQVLLFSPSAPPSSHRTRARASQVVCATALQLASLRVARLTAVAERCPSAAQLAAELHTLKDRRSWLVRRAQVVECAENQPDARTTLAAAAAALLRHMHGGSQAGAGPYESTGMFPPGAVGLISLSHKRGHDGGGTDGDDEVLSTHHAALDLLRVAQLLPSSAPLPVRILSCPDPPVRVLFCR